MAEARTLLQVTRSGWGGGLERFVRDLADEAATRGWRSIVAYYAREAPPATEANYLRLPSGGRLHSWPLPLVRLARRLRPDVIHLHGTGPGSLGAVALRAAGFSFLFTDHNVHALSTPRIRAARSLAARLPMVNVGVSREVTRSLVEDAGVLPGRAMTIPYGIEDAAGLAPPSNDGDRRLVYVANLWPWKGHRFLVEAMSILGKDSGLKVAFAGDGVQRSDIRGEVQRLGLEDRISLNGYLPDPWSVAEGAWAYVHPSLRDGLPLAVLEAMMRGLPVIASAVGGIPEVVIEGHNGILVPPGDAPALAAAIGRLIGDRDLRDRMGAAAREFALREFRLADCLERYFDLYEGPLEVKAASARPSGVVLEPKPLVSVVIPTKDRPGLLPRALRSVAGQNYWDIEVLVVDDGSDPPAALPPEMATDPRFRMIRLDSPVGAAEARNRGIAEARGLFLAFLDDDDEWLPQRIERDVESLTNAPEGVGAIESGYEARDGGSVVFRHVPNRERELRDALLVHHTMVTSTVTVRRQVFDAVGSFDPQLQRQHDWELWLRITDRYTIASSPQIQTVRRAHAAVSPAVQLDTYRAMLEKLEPRISALPQPRQARVRAHHLFILGTTMAKAGKRAEARRSLLNAWRMVPTNPKPLMHLPRTVVGEKAWSVVARAADTYRRLRSRLRGRDPLLKIPPSGP